MDIAAGVGGAQGEGEAVHVPAHHTCHVSHVSHGCPPGSLGHGRGVGPGDLHVLVAAGQLVQALLATRQLVAVLSCHRADLNLGRKFRIGLEKTYLHSRPTN